MSSTWQAPGASEEQAARPGAAPSPAPAAHGADAPGPVDGAAQARTRELAHRAPLFPLRPMGVGELLGAAARIYRDRPRTLLSITAIVLAVTYALSTVFGGISLTPLLLGLQDVATSTDPETAPELGTGSLLAFALGMLASGFVSMLGTQLVAVAVSALTVGEATGRPLTTAEVWAAMRRRGPAAVGVALLIGVLDAVALLVPVAIVAGMALLAGDDDAILVVTAFVAAVIATVLMIWIWVRTLLAVPAVTIEGVGPVRGLRRSFALTRGARLWRPLGIGVLLNVIVSVALQVLQSGLGVVGLAVYVVILLATDGQQLVLAAVVMLVLTMAAAFVSSVLALPFLAAGISALYADARMRHEGWDVELRRASRHGGVTEPERVHGASGPLGAPGAPGAPISRDPLGAAASPGPAGER